MFQINDFEPYLFQIRIRVLRLGRTRREETKNHFQKLAQQHPRHAKGKMRDLPRENPAMQSPPQPRHKLRRNIFLKIAENRYRLGFIGTARHIVINGAQLAFPAWASNRASYRVRNSARARLMRIFVADKLTPSVSATSS